MSRQGHTSHFPGIPKNGTKKTRQQAVRSKIKLLYASPCLFYRYLVFTLFISFANITTTPLLIKDCTPSLFYGYYKTDF